MNSIHHAGRGFYYSKKKRSAFFLSLFFAIFAVAFINGQPAHAGAVQCYGEFFDGSSCVQDPNPVSCDCANAGTGYTGTPFCTLVPQSDGCKGAGCDYENGHCVPPAKSCPNGTKCDGSSVTGSPGDSVCGSNLHTWTCNGATGQWDQGNSCSCPSDCNNNGVKDGTEECDGTSFGTSSCSTIGWTGGTLSCTSNCKYNTSQCGRNVCGTGTSCVFTKGVSAGADNCTPDAGGHDAEKCAAASTIPSITSGGSASGTIGIAFSYDITATNGPTSFNATGLPAGLTLNSGTGRISGTPTTAGTSDVSISATNGSGTGNGLVRITISATLAAPSITSAGTASGAVGAPFTYTISATNSPTSYGASGLPAGLSINSTSGLISGTPTTAGTANVTLTATNGIGTGSKTLSLTIDAAPTAPPTITSARTVTGQIGVAFVYQIIATNRPSSFSASAVPGGLSLNSIRGEIAGKPTTAGTFPVTLTATNSLGTATLNLTITIVPAPPTAPSALLTNALAYPVPYRPASGHNKITFTNLNSDASVTIKIYTITGELVKELHNTGAAASLDWTPVSNDNGEPVASGVYIYQIKNTSDEKRGKLVIIR